MTVYDTIALNCFVLEKFEFWPIWIGHDYRSKNVSSHDLSSKLSLLKPFHLPISHSWVKNRWWYWKDRGKTTDQRLSRDLTCSVLLCAGGTTIQLSVPDSISLEFKGRTLITTYVNRSSQYFCQPLYSCSKIEHRNLTAFLKLMSSTLVTLYMLSLSQELESFQRCKKLKKSFVLQTCEYLANVCCLWSSINALALKLPALKQHCTVKMRMAVPWCCPYHLSQQPEDCYLL